MHIAAVFAPAEHLRILHTKVMVTYATRAGVRAGAGAEAEAGAKARARGGVRARARARAKVRVHTFGRAIGIS